MNNKLIFLGLVLLSLTACESLQQHRKITVVETEESPGLTDAICRMEIGSPPNTCVDNSLVHRHYSYKGKPHDYYTAFVEFDDQGWFWDRKQLESLLRFLYQPEEKDKDEYLIVLYAHGWQHNAKACDNNVVCFQRLLERFDVLEQRSTKRKVVGIYVGWRGRSLSVPGFDNLTFWERKKTASRVGTGGVTHLISQLNEFRNFKNTGRHGDKTQLIITGHSFGGLVIFSALSNLMVKRSSEMIDEGGRIEYNVAKSVGDLVVLINPAFEGSLYEPLYQVATNRCFPSRQRPVMLIVTSESDLATRLAFPAGRVFNTFYQRTQSKKTRPGQRETIMRAVGHLDRYRTHRLELADDRFNKDYPENEEADCGCPWLPEINEFDLAGDMEFVNRMQKYDDGQKKSDRYKGEPISDETKETINFHYGNDLKLSREVGGKKYAPNVPFLVIQASKNIIRDHSSIYDENFTDFLRRFYIRHVKERRNFPQECFRDVPACIPTDVTPCEQSCQRDDGSSCSSRPSDIGVVE